MPVWSPETHRRKTPSRLSAIAYLATLPNKLPVRYSIVPDVDFDPGNRHSLGSPAWESTLKVRKARAQSLFQYFQLRLRLHRLEIARSLALDPTNEAAASNTQPNQ